MGCCCSSSDRVEPTNTSQIPLKGYKGSNENSTYEFEPPPKHRSCTDVIFLFLLFVFLGVLVYFLFYCYLNGDIDRVLNGYDSCGNICGKKNEPNSEISCFGVDHTNAKYLQMSGIIEKEALQGNIHRTCVSQCGEGYRKLLNRCIPESSATTNTNIHFTKTAISDFLQEVTEDLDLCKMEILYLFLIAFGFSILLLIFFRFLAGVVVWVILIGAMITSVAGTIFLWILWKRKKDELKSRKHDVATEQESVTSYLVFAISATIVTVIIWLVILVMRKRIKLVVQLFKEAGKAVSSMPCLLFEPILTFLAIGSLIAVWLYCSIWIESSGFLIKSKDEPKYYYKKNIIIKVARWYNLFALFWLIQFCVGCQHMVIAGAVSKWFFTRDRNSLGCPIARGFWNLVRYHLGSVALGSFLIALVQIVRAALKYIESKTKAGENAVSRCIFRTCQCCLWCFEKILQFFSRNAYIEVAMNGYSFCKGGQQAFKLLASNALRVAAINSVGDFVLFLGKAIVVIATVLIGVEMLHAKEEIQHKWIPLALTGLFAYIVVHIFVTVYEMAIDTIFLCFCEDCEQNDGLSRPYYMSRGLMEFVQNSKRALSIHDHPRSEAWSTSSQHQK